MTNDMTLMVIDDSQAMRFLVKKYIHHMRPDLHVVEADSAEDARSKLGAQHVDFILVDHKMPGDDGLTFITKLREDPKNQQKIVMLTANIQDELGAQFKGLGIPFFHKPPTEAVVQQVLDYYFDD